MKSSGSDELARELAKVHDLIVLELVLTQVGAELL